MDRISTPANTWFVCLQYVTSVLNFTYSEKIKCTPLFAFMGSTNDISMLLYFHFWEPIYFQTGEKPTFPSESHESRGQFVGFAEHVGHAMTFKVLTNETQKVLCRSNVHSALVPGEQNLRVDLIGGEEPSFVKLCHDATTHQPFNPGGDLTPIPPQAEEKEVTYTSQPLRFHPSDLIGWTFLLGPQEDRQQFCAGLCKPSKTTHCQYRAIQVPVFDQ